MDIRRKLWDIKIEKLPKETIEKLLSIERETSGFTIKIPEAEEYVRALHKKLSDNTPELLFSSGLVKPLLLKNYHLLVRNLRSLELRRDQINRELDLVYEDFRIAKSVFEPHITINEVNTPSMGHRYIGKFRVYLESKTTLVTISIGKFQDFKGKDDPNLLKIAQEKAVALVKSKFSDWF